MKLFLIDGFSLLYRLFFGYQHGPAVTAAGEQRSAVRGFMHTIEEIKKKEKPTHLAVALDPQGPTFRHQAFAQYKAQREKMPEELRASLPMLREMLDQAGIPVYVVDGFEADDIIGSLAQQAEASGFEVFMLTSDKDYAQLITDSVYMYRPRTGGGYEVLDKAKALEKFGVQEIEQIVDLLALMGDKADNIPGCPGIGEKTAVRLLAQFGSVEGLLAHTSSVKGVLRYRIQQNADEIRFSRTLVRIRRDVPLTFDPQATLLPPTLSSLGDLFSSSPLPDLFSSSPSPPPASPPPLPSPPLPSASPSASASASPCATGPAMAATAEAQQELGVLLQQQPYFAIFLYPENEDLKNNILAPPPTALLFTLASQESYLVPLPLLKPLQGDSSEIVAALTNPEIEKAGHDLKAVILCLRQEGIRMRGPLFDSLIAHYLLYPQVPHNLTYIVHSCLKPPKGKSVDKQYPHLREYLLKRLEAEESGALFREVEMPLVYVLAEMEFTGVRLDKETLNQSSLSLGTSLRTLEEEIYGMAGKAFNINSTRQIASLLKDDFKIPFTAKTKTGQYSTGEAVLDQLREHHPVIGKILEYRQVKKLLSTYVEALPRLVRPDTGKIHTSFHQAVVSTGRLSSSNPNLQNIPVRNELGREIRKAFRADDEGCVFFSADYSQIELRILAHLSRDMILVDSFHNGEDIHSATACKIFRVSETEVTAEMRRKAKSANFGIIYGISPFGLSRALNISREESKSLIDNYFASYPEVRKFLDQNLELARKKGYIETLLHRRTAVSNLDSANRAVRAAAERFVTNAPIQGSAAEVIKLAMIAIARRFEEEGLKARMIMQVHDELNFNVPMKELESVREIVIEEMESAYALEVPLKVDFGYGDNWLAAH
ncbi:MAG: DNA polymerase I [Tannerellaceae bacterium]|jgi:DNA polymerase-1|nr:DNA polymerase I [Tannerellaceae bacterium]